jgi:protein tyrosine/serine phosphatase
VVSAVQAYGPLPQARDIPRFGWVETWLARGAQPERRGWRWLAENRFDIIVNLRMRNESKSAVRANPHARCIHIPVRNNRPPTDEQALRWLQICKANRRRERIFIHCGLGEGRTSVFCALLRIAQGIPLDHVLLEERSFGFKPRGEHRAQAQYLTEFEKRVRSKELHVPNFSSRR